MATYKLEYECALIRMSDGQRLLLPPGTILETEAPLPLVSPLTQWPGMTLSGHPATPVASE